MSRSRHIRRGWLKAMYIYTIAGAGAFGVGIILAPDAMCSLFRWPQQDLMVLRITGSVYLAFALVSVFGLRSPVQFSPVLLLQLGYKSIWFIGVVLPILIAGKFPTYAILPAVILATYIIGDVIAIPFSYLFTKHGDPASLSP